MGEKMKREPFTVDPTPSVEQNHGSGEASEDTVPLRNPPLTGSLMHLALPNIAQWGCLSLYRDIVSSGRLPESFGGALVPVLTCHMTALVRPGDAYFTIDPSWKKGSRAHKQHSFKLTGHRGSFPDASAGAGAHQGPSFRYWRENCTRTADCGCDVSRCFSVYVVHVNGRNPPLWFYHYGQTEISVAMSRARVRPRNSLAQPSLPFQHNAATFASDSKMEDPTWGQRDLPHETVLANRPSQNGSTVAHRYRPPPNASKAATHSSKKEFNAGHRGVISWSKAAANRCVAADAASQASGGNRLEEAPPSTSSSRPRLKLGDFVASSFDIDPPSFLVGWNGKHGSSFDYLGSSAAAAVPPNIPSAPSRLTAVPTSSYGSATFTSSPCRSGSSPYVVSSALSAVNHLDLERSRVVVSSPTIANGRPVASSYEAAPELPTAANSSDASSLSTSQQQQQQHDLLRTSRASSGSSSSALPATPMTPGIFSAWNTSLDSNSAASMLWMVGSNGITRPGPLPQAAWAVGRRIRRKDPLSLIKRSYWDGPKSSTPLSHVRPPPRMNPPAPAEPGNATFPLSPTSPTIPSKRTRAEPVSC